MKKYLGIFFLIISFLYIPKASFATGTFQLMHFPNQFNALVGSDFSTRIDFVYSERVGSDPLYFQKVWFNYYRPREIGRIDFSHRFGYSGGYGKGTE